MTVTVREYQELRQKALDGAHLLDARRPGWALRIKLSRLNLGMCDRCVLGQEFGNYTMGAAELGIDGRPYGFNIDWYKDGYRSYIALTRIWKDIIRKWRRAELAEKRAKARA